MVHKDYPGKNSSICRVTFVLPPSMQAKSASVVGDFNSWDKDATPMIQDEDGTWQAVVDLEVGREYQYRFFVNGNTWANDEQADKFAAHPYGGENSVVVT
jgi:1,4-alpha-glucan branching enzyme